MPGELTDYNWLVSGVADEWLRMGKDAEVTPSLVARLRREVSVDRARLIVTQWILRRNARRKFSRADDLFWEASALEQATDETIANYKASTLPPRIRMADLCCGIGGDAMGLARVTQLTAVERDTRRATLAEANLERHGGCEYQVRRADALQIPLADFDGWHVDPDRRVSGRRTTRGERMEPAADKIANCLATNPHGLVKVAPASRIPQTWMSLGEQEWIGHSRQCQQQLWRFGRWVRHPGKRVATILARSVAARPYHLVEQSCEPLRRVERVGEFLIEPQAAIMAAGLADQFASTAGLDGFPSRIAYYSSAQPLHDGPCTCYRVLAALPFDARAIRQWLRDHRARVTRVKKRGVELDPAQVVRQLRSAGDRPLTLILFPTSDRVTAVLAEP